MKWKKKKLRTCEHLCQYKDLHMPQFAVNRVQHSPTHAHALCATSEHTRWVHSASGNGKRKNEMEKEMHIIWRRHALFIDGNDDWWVKLCERVCAVRQAWWRRMNERENRSGVRCNWILCIWLLIAFTFDGADFYSVISFMHSLCMHASSRLMLIIYLLIIIMIVFPTHKQSQ